MSKIYHKMSEIYEWSSTNEPDYFWTLANLTAIEGTKSISTTEGTKSISTTEGEQKEAE